LRVADSVVRDPVDVRRLDRAAVAVQGREPDVIQHDVDDTGRAAGSLRRLERLPVRHRVPDIDVDRSLERLAHPVLLQATPGTRDLSPAAARRLTAEQPG